MTEELLEKNWPQVFQYTYYKDGYFNPIGGYAEATNAMKYLYKLANEYGVKIFSNTEVYDLLTDNNLHSNDCFSIDDKYQKVYGIKYKDLKLNEKKISVCDQVVISCGAWTPFLIPQLRDHFYSNGQPVFILRVKISKLFFDQVTRSPSLVNPSLPNNIELTEDEEIIAKYMKIPVWAADLANLGWYGFPTIFEQSNNSYFAVIKVSLFIYYYF